MRAPKGGERERRDDTPNRSRRFVSSFYYLDALGVLEADVDSLARRDVERKLNKTALCKRAANPVTAAGVRRAGEALSGYAVESALRAAE